jgi:hypothetical protein
MNTDFRRHQWGGALLCLVLGGSATLPAQSSPPTTSLSATTGRRPSASTDQRPEPREVGVARGQTGRVGRQSHVAQHLERA